ncbi:protein phosphatase 2C domain-containing protein [Paenibacillus sp. MER TA 81-3]|uniref:PP2C family protein-serine/threonine phosphatase n=1 Tax=Paenibacillus sp. MER TA 81-3 TaxID=2939573 RepID=UPI00203ADA82|nr:protein phosphatase 2C domain-containing protein [Paenibacillus sp. MER TA 81-3]MCM3340828.1 protein phosphatase 2C domain-containing protein [Paenibacillus sp. MER TA 81-3]
MEVQDWVPYLIVLGSVAALLLLFGARRRLMTEAASSEPAGIPIGNGQTIGAREEQDDYFSSVATVHGTAAVLADGISGLANGRMASTLAVTVFIREFLKLEDIRDVQHYFTKAAKVSNTEILRNLKGATGGTTLVAAVIADDRLYWGAVGDSIIMVFRNGEFIRMNEKHTLESVLQERYLTGEMTREEALEHPMKRRLINYLGYENFKSIEIGSDPFELQPGDRVILCSDGVYNTLTEVEMEHILSKPLPPHDAAEEIIEAIEQKRLANQDNATVIIVDNV